MILFFVFVNLTCAMGAAITLTWNANSEPDLDGYKLYYKTGSSGVPYNGVGAKEGKSPVKVNKTLTGLKLTGLSDTQIYYFAVTAYDMHGLESDYSKELSPCYWFFGWFIQGKANPF